MTGAASGSVLVLSCGDNLSVKASADAAVDALPAPDAASTCNCPPAEPPLADRLVLHDGFHDLDPDGQGGTSVGCSGDERAISGSCTVFSPYPYQDVILRESGFEESFPDPRITGWRCSYRNTGTIRIRYRVMVLCLKPAP